MYVCVSMFVLFFLHLQTYKIRFQSLRLCLCVRVYQANFRRFFMCQKFRHRATHLLRSYIPKKLTMCKLEKSDVVREKCAWRHKQKRWNDARIHFQYRLIINYCKVNKRRHHRQASEREKKRLERGNNARKMLKKFRLLSINICIWMFCRWWFFTSLLHRRSFPSIRWHSTPVDVSLSHSHIVPVPDY